MLRLINTCSKAKESWDILKFAQEDSLETHMPKLLSTRIENLRMKEETFGISKAYSTKYINESEYDDDSLTKEEIYESDRSMGRN